MLDSRLGFICWLTLICRLLLAQPSQEAALARVALVASTAAVLGQQQALPESLNGSQQPQQNT
jgi:hypothetical protein